MNRFALPFAAAAALVLQAGCAQTPPPAPASGECDGQAAQFAVGRPFDAALAEEARVRAHAERVRTVRPGQMVTMEFDARRLTIQLDAQDRVLAARCG